MTCSNPKPSIQRRNKLWYGRYDHSITFYLPEAACLRKLDHRRIDKLLDIRSAWGHRLSHNPGGSWRGNWTKLQITEDTRRNLHDMCDWLLASNKDIKMMIFGDWVYCYTTDPDAIQAIQALPWLDPTLMKVTRLDIAGPENAVIRRRPKHKYRTYLRYTNNTHQQAEHLRNMLLNQTDLRLSPSLQFWLARSYKNTFEYYFIDHDDLSIVTLLGLINPRLVRKTLPIVADK